MNLTEIIETISNPNGNLESALLSTKIIAHRSNNETLEKWVDSEISGYKEFAQLPKYRILPIQIMGAMSNGSWTYEHNPVPLIGIDNDKRIDLEKFPVYMGINTIVETIKQKKMLIIPIDPRICAILSKNLSNGFHILTAQKELSYMQLIDVLNETKKILLEFLLKLEAKITDADISESKYSEATTQAVETSASGIIKVLSGQNNTIIAE